MQNAKKIPLLVTFILLNLYALGVWLICSLFHLPALPFVSVAFYGLMGVILYRSFRNRSFGSPTLHNQVGWGLTLIYGSLVYFWLKDVLVTPSNDDTINHLSYLQALMNSKSCLLGNVMKPGSEWFGEQKNHFYPTGSHGLIALWYYPFSLIGIKIWQFMKWSTIGVLTLWPLALWKSSTRAFPEIPLHFRLFIVVSAVTLPIFPLWSLGEGGISRIFAFVFFTPLWFEVIAGTMNGFIWSAVIAPILLFIHPSIVPFIGISTLFFNKKNFLMTTAGAVIGAGVFWLVLHTGEQEIFALKIIPEFNGWFDRLKGPFHYWFSDPYGFGKFLSLKNLLPYLGLILMLRGKMNYRMVLLFCLPFVLAALAFQSPAWAQQLSLIYYHSAKRIGELTPLIGFTLACFSVPFVLKYQDKLKYVLGSLAAIYFLIFAVKSNSGLDVYHSLYDTPRPSQFVPIAAKLELLPANSIIIVDDHHYDALKFMLKQTVLNKWAECSTLEANSTYCLARSSFVQNITDPKFNSSLAGREVWWIPGPKDQVGKSLQELNLDEKGKIYRLL